MDVDLQTTRSCRVVRCFVLVLAITFLVSSGADALNAGDAAARLLQDAGSLLGGADGSLLDASDAAAAPSRNGIRSLAAQPQQGNGRAPPVVPQCFWDSQAQVCDTDDAVNIMYAIEAKPMSAYLWFLLMTYDRETTCGLHTTASACRGDKTHRCIYFDDILSIIGGGKSGSSSSSSSSSNSSSSGSSAGSRKASKTSRAGSSESEEEFATELPVIAAWWQQAVQQEQQQGSSSSLSSEAVREQLSEQLHQQQRQLLELLTEQLSPEQQQLLPAMLMAAQQPGSGIANTAKAPTANPQKPAPPKKPTAATGSKPAAANPPGKPATAAASSSSSSAAGAASPGGRSQIMCTSTDLLENYIFTKSAYSNPLQAPLAMHCPGSRAANLINCMRLPNLAACRADPACVVVPGNASGGTADMCVSRQWHGLDAQQMKKFTFDTTLAEPSALGSCDGACWMRQALLCNRTTDAEACSALTFCRSSPSGLCTPRLYTQDNFGSTVQEYMGECVDVDNQKDCEGLRLRLVNKGAYAAWNMPKSASLKCSVPSIGGLLGGKESREAARVSPTSSGIIMQAGAREERAAEMQAAAAAAAAAANAARLVLGRGPSVLRQIYFTEDRPGPDSP